MKDLIKYLELKFLEYKKECKALEALEARNALKEAKEAEVVIYNLLNEMSGNEKSCGHDFDCSCAFNAAKDILK